MSPAIHRRRRVALATSLACVAFVAGVSAQDDAFKRGLQARENKQWPVVASRMREAIAERTRETTSKIGAVLGIGGTEYLPHYFLAEALFMAGDCSGAVNEWVTSEEHGAVQKSRPEFMKVLRNGYVECEKKGVLPPSKLDAALARISVLIKEANTQVGTLANLGQANPDIWRAEAGTRDQFEKARAEIESARARYEAARTTRLQAHIDEAANAVQRARTILLTAESNFLAAIANQQSVQKLAQLVAEAISGAEGQMRDIEEKRVAFTPAMTTALQEGRDALTRARERLNEGQKTLSQPTLNAARGLAQDASARLKLVLDEIGKKDRDDNQRLVGEASTRAGEAFLLLETAVATLDRFAAERANVLDPDKVAERDAVKRDVERVRRRLESARKLENVDQIAAAAKSATELRDRLNLIIGAFGPLTLRDRGVRAQLEAGARQFFGGEYQQAVASLADAESLEPEVPLRLHFHLFKAAALYELFLRSRETDQALRTQALAEVEHCKAIDSAFQPDGRAFSPRFLSFYQSVAPPAATATSQAPG